MTSIHWRIIIFTTIRISQQILHPSFCSVMNIRIQKELPCNKSSFRGKCWWIHHRTLLRFSNFFFPFTATIGDRLDFMNWSSRVSRNKSITKVKTERVHLLSHRRLFFFLAYFLSSFNSQVILKLCFNMEPIVLIL